MNKKWLLALALSSSMMVGGFANQDFGVVNFSTIVEDSKLGQDKQKDFKKFSDELQDRLKKMHTEYTDLEKKLEDTDYLDTLSPEAEKDLQTTYEMIQRTAQK